MEGLDYEEYLSKGKAGASKINHWPVLRLIKIVVQFLKCAAVSTTVLEMVQSISNPAHLRLFVDLISLSPPYVQYLSLQVLENLVTLNLPTEILNEATGGDFVTWLLKLYKEKGLGFQLLQIILWDDLSHRKALKERLTVLVKEGLVSEKKEEFEFALNLLPGGKVF